MLTKKTLGEAQHKRDTQRGLLYTMAGNPRLDTISPTDWPDLKAYSHYIYTTSLQRIVQHFSREGFQVC